MNVKTAVVLWLSFLSTPIVAAEREDFGLRITAGGVAGIGDQVLPELSFWGDFFLLSPNTRMLFGFDLMLPQTSNLPLVSLQSIGVEQNISLGRNRFFFGALYNKAYFEKEAKGFTPAKGFSFHIGYKYRLARFHDVVLWLGHQYQPLAEQHPNPELQLDANTFYGRLGWEWYF